MSGICEVSIDMLEGCYPVAYIETCSTVLNVSMCFLIFLSQYAIFFVSLGSWYLIPCKNYQGGNSVNR